RRVVVEVELRLRTVRGPGAFVGGDLVVGRRLGGGIGVAAATAASAAASATTTAGARRAFLRLGVTGLRRGRVLRFGLRRGVVPCRVGGCRFGHGRSGGCRRRSRGGWRRLGRRGLRQLLLR